MRKSFEFMKFMGLNPKTGVELGVWHGVNAKDILENFPELKLYLVENRPQAEMVSNLQRFGDRVSYLFKNSQEAVLNFQDNSLDFVYIDADHSYDSVKNDLHCWYPKVRKGGVICGHDYNMKGASTNNADNERVFDAVNEFLIDSNLSISFGVNSNDANNQDWWVIKC